jgi:hypothetical protein
VSGVGEGRSCCSIGKAVGEMGNRGMASIGEGAMLCEA